MGTVNIEGVPDVSYAAYVAYEGDYYIYVSELSRHTQNLMDTGRVSLLFIENEDRARHLFVRQRMTLECKAQEVIRGTQRFESMMDRFAAKFGKFMQMLKGLSDFHLFRITPLQGSYVRGFAQAFRLEGKDLLQVSHVNDTGHRAQDQETREQMDQQVASS